MQPRTGQRNSPDYITAPISNYPSAFSEIVKAIEMLEKVAVGRTAFRPV